MLVSYRRVPRGPAAQSGSVASKAHLSNLRRPSMHKAASDVVTSLSQRRRDPDIVDDVGGDTETSETELPEVVLDRNRHIIPEWMLRGQRGRALSQSAASLSPTFANRHLRRHHLNGYTASSPDLGLSASSSRAMSFSTPGYKPPPSPLAQAQAANFDAPTPVNSPRSVPSSLSTTPRASMRLIAQDTEDAFAPSSFSPEQPFSSPQGVFGGRGSTMVNTRFKDHVFSTLLRRICRRRRSGARTDDDGDIADGEGEGLGAGMLNGRRKKLSQVDRLRLEEGGLSLRRTRSDDHLEAQPADIFSFEEEDESGQRAFAEPNGGGSFVARSRRHSSSRPTDHLSASHRLMHPHLPTEHPASPAKRETEGSVTRQNHFILMEDLTGRLKHSCVLDLKMGTRQYGMDATSLKKKSQRKKCDRTTSRTLGVRVCGMQVSSRTLTLCFSPIYTCTFAAIRNVA